MVLFVIKIGLLATAILFSVASFHFAANSDFKPQSRIRVILFMSGFAVAFFCAWLAIQESITYMFWLKLLVGGICGWSSAYVLPKRWQYIQSMRKSKN